MRNIESPGERHKSRQRKIDGYKYIQALQTPGLQPVHKSNNNLRSNMTIIYTFQQCVPETHKKHSLTATWALQKIGPAAK